MLPRIPLLAAVLTLASLPVRALNIAGHVLDKAGQPIETAKVCVKVDASKCVSTDAEGAFHIESANGIRAGLPQSAPYRMEIRNGTLFLTAPASGKARLEWIAAGGRILLSVSEVDLAPGRNAIALPRALPGAGICFIRLRTPDMTLSWKAVLMGSGSIAPSAGAVPGAESGTVRIAALSKASAAGTLEISKAGFRTRTYEPMSDPETDAVIYLSALDDVGLTFSGNFHAKVISIDRAAEKMVVESIDSYCDSDRVVRDTSRDTSRYAFINGNLWLWTQGECFGQVFTGKGSDPVGTWTLTDPNAELPADQRADCVPDTTSDEGNPFQNYTATYAITETTITGDVSIEFCPADIYGPLIGLLFADDSTITLEKNTCKQIVYKNGAGETGTMDFSKQADSLKADFTYKTTTCTFTQDLGVSDAEPTCPESDELLPFFMCMAGSGFSDGGLLGAPFTGTPKSSASRLPMSLENRLHSPLGIAPAAIKRSFPVPRLRPIPVARLRSLLRSH